MLKGLQQEKKKSASFLPLEYIFSHIGNQTENSFSKTLNLYPELYLWKENSMLTNKSVSDCVFVC